MVAELHAREVTTMLTLWRHARLATMAGSKPWGWIDDGALLIDGATIHWSGADADVPTAIEIGTEHDLGGALVTPGLIDCHTHLVYAGQPRARVRTTPARRELRGDRARRRRHPIDRRRDARCER